MTAKDNPLPVWDLLEAELINAVRLRVFWNELKQSKADALAELFHGRKQKSLYFVPELDRIALMETFNKLARHTPEPAAAISIFSSSLAPCNFARPSSPATTGANPLWSNAPDQNCSRK